MCFYYAIVKKNPERLLKNKVITEEQLDLFKASYLINGFENPTLPVVTRKGDLRFFEWGMVPANMKKLAEKKNFRERYNTLNAKAETIFKSKMYSEAILNRRCLVVCSGFFEWREHKGKKFPYFITLKNDDVFVFGGIYNEYTDTETGELTGSYAIVTLPANELMATIHNTKKRMPLILEPENALKWLKEDLKQPDIEALITGIESEKLAAHTIQKFIPSDSANAANKDLTAYYHYPELSEQIEQQGNLFDDL